MDEQGISPPDREISRRNPDGFQEKSTPYGGERPGQTTFKASMCVMRTALVIDENGVAEKVMPKVRPGTNAAEVLAYLKQK